MKTLKNFAAVDWRSGKDRFYFFFKDTNTYTRFDLGDNETPKNYPRTINGYWGDMDAKLKNLRFGFATTGISPANYLELDSDILWLFYYEDGIPMVCKYDQDTDKVNKVYRLADSIWHRLLPYFDRIVAGTWWEQSPHPRLFRFLMNDGNCLTLNLAIDKLTQETISETWSGLAPYKDRIITAVQNDRTLAHNYYYIFLTDNEYLRYSVPSRQLLAGPIAIDDASWPGLLRD